MLKNSCMRRGSHLPGSLSAKQPTCSPLANGVIHCCFCSSEPNFKIGPM